MPILFIMNRVINKHVVNKYYNFINAHIHLKLYSFIYQIQSIALQVNEGKPVRFKTGCQVKARSTGTLKRSKHDFKSLSRTNVTDAFMFG